MPTLLVLGAGQIGRLVSHLLASSGDYSVRLGDLRGQAARSATEHLDAAEGLELAFDDGDALERAMQGADGVISCAPFHCNPLIARTARALGLHYFDLTEDVAVTREVAELAEDAGSAFAPQCGLAPGFINIAAAGLIEGMDEIHDLRLRVGALPRYPSNRLKYNLTWSTAGLINEYIHPCEALVDGEPVQLPALENLEHLTVDGVEYEAFNTSGGVSTLADALRGRARNVNYKTMRYPGHSELLKLLLDDLGLRDHPEELGRIFERALPATDQDQVVVYVGATGKVDGRLIERTHARTHLHREIDGRPWTAIQITTAAGVTTVVDLLFAGELPQKGFVRQDQVPLKAFLANRFGKLYLGS